MHQQPGRNGDRQHLEQHSPVRHGLRRERRGVIAAGRAEPADERSGRHDEPKGQTEEVEIEGALQSDVDSDHAQSSDDAREGRQEFRGHVARLGRELCPERYRERRIHECCVVHTVRRRGADPFRPRASVASPERCTPGGRDAA